MITEPHDNFFGLILPDGVILAAVILIAQSLATVHILSNKREVRSAIAWVGLVWLAPGFGLFAYFLFGINRIRRRAQITREKRGLPARADLTSAPAGFKLRDLKPDAQNRWRAHDRLAGKVAGFPLVGGNHIRPLMGGREAYDAMIDAIDNATVSIALTTYIFQIDQAGRRFVKALIRAHERGVDVRVLVDAVGNLYGLRPVSNILRRNNVPVAVFNPARLSWRLAFFNLRTHRKLLIVDGAKAFAGGMNIRRHHLERADGTPRVQDTHFMLEGPIARQMMDVFADDWAFADGEMLEGPIWFPKPADKMSDKKTDADNHGDRMPARAIPDGPDEPRHKTAMVIESAIAAAREQVHIITPYFLPDEALISALSQAALRGVRVNILLPEKNNLPLFGLASMASLKPLISAGCHIFAGAPPFDHSKLMIVDKSWVLMGSSNWDARSLKLNFEFNVECYSKQLAQTMLDWTNEKFKMAQPVTKDSIKQRPFFKRVFGRIFWLATPYL